MEIYIFGRFHARAGMERALEEALQEVLPPTREEPGCLEVHGYRSLRDARLFFLQSRWKDQEAFDAHAKLPHVVKFLGTAEALLDEARDVVRTERIG